MISKEHNTQHKKHTDLKRPVFGVFNRNEWAILGAPCTTIKLLVDQVISALSLKYKCAYVDTTHNDDIILLPGKLSAGATMEYTNQVNYGQLNYCTAFNQFQLRDIFAQADIVLVNGNHQQAKAQVLIIHNNKKASLQKRVEQLTNVAVILLADDADDIFDFVKEAVPNWQSLPIYRLDETEKIIAFFEKQLQQTKPVLNGLVLAGGKSERMGFDKGAVNWYGKEQRYHIADILKTLCSDVFISCRADQQREIDPAYPSIADTFTGLGPYGAILSAFREKPDDAWLVVACDLPLINYQTLKYLTDNRDSAATATAYQSTFNNFPEPLITIWEPKCYSTLLKFLAQGYSCPRKVLINSDIKLLNAPNTDDLTNVNTPEELERIKQILHQKVAAE